MIEIGAETPDLLFQDIVNVSPYGWWNVLKYYETQYQILKSRSLLTKAAERAIAKNVVTGMSVKDVASMLRGGISIGSDDQSRLATIYFDDSNAKRAAALANVIAETYVDENLARKLEGITQAVDWLTQRLEEIRKEKRLQEEELQKYKEKHRVVSMADHEGVAKSNLLALSESQNRLRNERIELQAQYEKLKAIVTTQEGNLDDLLGVLSSDLLTKLKYDLAELRSQRSRYSQTYLDKHPKMVQINAQVASVEKAIRQEITNEVDRLKTKYLLAKAEEESIGKALETQKIEALRTEEVTRKLADIQMVTAMNQQLFEALQKKLKEADLSALVRSNNIRILDAALEPFSPIRPNVATNMLLSLVIGLLGGIGLALAIEYLDDTLKTHDDIERFLALPVLGVIPRLTPSESGLPRKIELMPYLEPSEPISEFYRTLRTNVLFLSATKGHKKLMFVSTGPTEGKTSCAINLAVTLAQIGERTLLLELDLRRPKLHRKLEGGSRVGLTDFLVGGAAVTEIVQHTEIPNLDYILAGTVPPNPAELVASEPFKKLLADLTGRYDRIVIDSSPIAPVADAVIIAQQVDGVIFVVRAGKTHRKAVRFAREQLDTVKANILGVVLNDVDVARSGYSNYQYYKYGYSGYATQRNEDEDGRGEITIPPASA